MMRRGFFSFSVFYMGLSSLVGGAHGSGSSVSRALCSALFRRSPAPPATAALARSLGVGPAPPATTAWARSLGVGSTPLGQEVFPSSSSPMIAPTPAQQFLRRFSSSRDTRTPNTRHLFQPLALFHDDTPAALQRRFKRVFKWSTKETEEHPPAMIRALVHASLLTGGAGPLAPDEVRILGLASEDLLPNPEQLWEVVPLTALYRALASAFPSVGAAAAGEPEAEPLSEFLSSLLNSASYVLDRERQSEADRAVDLFSMVQSERIVVSRQFVRGMLANAVLGNLKLDPVSERKYMYGGLDLVPLLGAASCPVAFAKTQCLVEYFRSTQQESAGPPRGAVSTTEEPQEPTSVSQNSAVEFRHVTLSEESFDRMVGLSSFRRTSSLRDLSSLRSIDLSAVSSPRQRRGPTMEELSSARRGPTVEELSPAQPLVVVHSRPMEALSHAHAFVDFANENFGVGRILPGSATQEEILQFTCPEFNLGMLHYGVIDENSVVVVHGVRRFSTYEGYGEGLRFTGGIEQGAAQAPSSPASLPPQSILVLDAVRKDHFAPASVKRDVKKFFLGLKATLEHHLATSGGGDRATLVVSTGKWGCGIFRGNVVHKFVQQYVAAKMVEEYFRSTTRCEAYHAKMVEECLRAKMVKDHAKMVEEYLCDRTRFVQLHFSSYGDGASRRTGTKTTLRALARVAAALDESGLSGAEIYERVLSTSSERADQKRFGRGVQDVERLLEHIRGVSVSTVPV